MRFFKGPPPHVGWRLTRDIIAFSTWRWWNGRNWSEGALWTDTAEGAAESAMCASRLSRSTIIWSDYYPPNARVPRVDPGVMK